ncbi:MULTISPECIES: MetQ/NlpA family ABC transporter substrate-binding protein [Tissierellales]|jgi:D-methionine transport system substrate-binding protein|uniref:Lipoprotein n=1 Tax=Acidilutibacter cellobiosedens TaxID=2507161 RepID=A0A410QB69_9FIRM|nr:MULTISPECIES: MetQ/NlpA family ABC transporter substrate-binding protein [Tissierellales]MBE6081925.1 MetQ/NlpA family ABC transporter substrate-binding protein [Tissierellaceae bacterium]QAT61272.1 MetQ/NlpA family ABC transporter substrate-binding protein [Acidilutibacter cellobiosedens]SCL96310.1 29 kDa protein [Sporanaerobacter sp. PP17-6a]
MKKFSLILIAILIFTLLTGCGKKESAENVIKIGVSPEPHKAIVDLIKDDLEKEGIKLEVIEFTDYVKPNTALADKEIDANFFQHLPYMNEFKEKQNINIVSIGAVHIEPMGLYSKKYKSIDEIPNGSTIAIPNDPTNGGRALLLLQENGIIKLKDPDNILSTENDIAENPKNLKFEALEAAQLPRVLGDVDGAVINGNYALEANLVPTKNALILEDKSSPYANIVAVRGGEENQEKFQKLIKALQSEKVKKFIEEKYNGGVIPAF